MVKLNSAPRQQTIQQFNSLAPQHEHFSLEEGSTNPEKIRNHSELNSKILSRHPRAVDPPGGDSCPSLRSICLGNYPDPRILIHNRQRNLSALVELRTVSRHADPAVRQQIAFLSPEWLARLTRKQIQLRLNGEVILDSHFYRALTRQQRNALTSEQISWIPTDVFGGLSADFFNQLTQSQLATLASAQIAAISPEVIPFLDLDFWKHMGRLHDKELRRIVGGFTPHQVSRIPAYIYREMLTGRFLLLLRPETFAAVPPRAFSTRTSIFIGHLGPNELRLLTPEQVSELPGDTFGTLSPTQIPHLNPAVFSRITPAQLGRWQEFEVRSITSQQLQQIPIVTLQRLGESRARQFYRTLLQSQRDALTEEQRAFFQNLSEAIPIERADRRNVPSPTPPSGRDNQGGNPGGGAAGGAGASGGARPKDPSVIAKFWGVLHGSHKRKQHLSLLPLDVIEKLPVDFWNDAAGPKPHFFWGGRLREKPEDRQEYEEMMEAFEPDQILAIPDNVLIKIDRIFIQSLNSEVFRHSRVVEKLFLNARQYPSIYDPNKKDLLGFKKDQIEKIDFSHVSARAIKKALSVGGITLMNMLTPHQKDQFNPEKRAEIPKEVYGELIKKLSQEMSDQEIQLYAIYMSLAEYRVAMSAIVDSITSGEGTLTDQERLAILKGTYRVKMEMKNSIPEQTIVSSASNRGEAYSVDLRPRAFYI